MNKKLLAIRKNYYSNPIVQSLICKYSENREIAFMDRKNFLHTIRLLWAREPKNLEWLFNWYDFYNEKGFCKDNYNIYLSNSKYRWLPRCDFNLKNRSKETNRFFKDYAHKYIVEFDLLLDFDFIEGKWQELKAEVFKMATILNDNKICFGVIPSGSGFQIIIPSEQIFFSDNCFNGKCFYRTGTEQEGYNHNIEKLKKAFGFRFDLKFLCKSNISSLTKLRKCEFSLVDDKICGLLNVSMIKEFEYIPLKDGSMPMCFDYGEYHNLENKNNISNFCNFLEKEKILKVV